MGIQSLLTKSVTEVAPLVEKGEVSPVELTKATLDAIDEMNPRTGSYIKVLHDVAMAEAKAAEAEIAQGAYRGKLHGLPYSIKDNVATKGITTTAGSVILKDYVPGFDSTIGERTREAGGVLVGKNNLHEFASGGTNDNPHFGRSGNAWDLTRIPGGSSGGSAAAVALGLGYYSYGTDGAGSVRIPASLCGVVGVKATYALLSRYGMIPAVGPGQDHGPGILARSVRDAALVMNAIVGYDEKDPASFRAEIPDYTAGLERDLRGLKVGVPTNFFFDGVDPETETAVRKAIDELAKMGVELEDVEIPFVEEAMAVSFVGSSSDFHRKNLRIRRQDYGDDLRYRFIAQEFVLAKDATRAQRVRDIFKASTQKLLTRFDALVSPTMMTPAYPFDAEEITLGSRKIRVKGPGAATDVTVRLTRPANIACISAISVPCGLTAGGLPIGLQIMGAPMAEPTIFAMGHQYTVAVGAEVCVAPPIAVAA